MTLEIAGLRKSFGGGFALDVPELAVGAGESVLLRGANGSGKTTFLKLVAGLIRPDSCRRFALGGQERGSWECDPRIAFLHQAPYLFDMPVLANVEYGLLRRSDPDPEAKALAALERFGMGELARRPVAGLSGGEIQRIALARVWVLRPEIYLLDEPLSHLDAEGAAEVSGLLAQLAEDGATMIVSSHEDIDCGRPWRRIAIGGGKLEG